MKNEKIVLQFKIFIIYFFVLHSFNQACSADTKPINTSLSIRPFSAYRPMHGLEEVVSCSPFNIINMHSMRLSAQQNEMSFLHILCPEVDLPPAEHKYHQKVYEKAREKIKKFVIQKWLVPDQKRSFYIYRQQTETQNFVAILAEVHLDGYVRGCIKPHELTREKNERWLKGLLKKQRADIDPVMLFYQASQRINLMINKKMAQNPNVDFIAENGIRHSVWVVQEKKLVRKFQRRLSYIKNLYIADGHHRLAVKSKMQQENRISCGIGYTGQERFNYVLAALYAHDQVHVQSYNRLVKKIFQKPEQFLRSLSQFFEIKEMDINLISPKKPHSFGMYLEGKWYKLFLKKQELEKRRDNPVQRLDAVILSELVFDQILHMSMADEKHTLCIPGSMSVVDVENRCKEQQYQAAFLMHDVRVQDIIDVVDTGKLMPPKTTFFSPKIRAGLFIRSFAEI